MTTQAQSKQSAKTAKPTGASTPDSKLTPEKLNALYAKLSADFPPEAIEKTDGRQTGRGYDTTGYGYQYIVNRLNEVLGVAHWTTKEEVKLVEKTTARSGAPRYEYMAKVTILIGNPTEDGFDTIAQRTYAQRTCYGGHIASSHGDAAKGAFTNAFKKTAALLGVGRQAYEGTIDDDSQPIGEPTYVPEPQRPTPQTQPQQAQTASRVCPVHNTPLKYYQGGISKRTGKAYNPRYSCTHRDENGAYCEHTEWVDAPQAQPRSARPATQTPSTQPQAQPASNDHSDEINLEDIPF